MAFMDPVPVKEIVVSIIYLLMYMGLFLGAAFIIFQRKDILS